MSDDKSSDKSCLEWYSPLQGVVRVDAEGFVRLREQDREQLQRIERGLKVLLVAHAPTFFATDSRGQLYADHTMGPKWAEGILSGKEED